MTFSTQIMFEPLRCLLKDVLLLFKIQDSVFFQAIRLSGIFAYPNGFQIYLGGRVRISGSLLYSIYRAVFGISSALLLVSLLCKCFEIQNYNVF